MYIVRIDHDKLINLLQDHYDDKIYENIQEDSMVENVEVGYAEIFITIGKED